MSNRNQETVEFLQEKVNEVTKNHSIIQNIERFELKNVKIDGTMSIGNKVFSEEAVKQTFDILKVQPAFKEYQKLMPEKDWEYVADKLKKANGDVCLYGDISGDGQVNGVYVQNPNKKKSDDMTHSLAIIDMIQNELIESECEYKLKKFEFNPRY